jgi:CheY-like chemotaxis protein
MAEHKVLVADDDPVLTATVSGALKSRGYTIVVARDAMQAFMFAVQQQPDVILLDINMPAGTGLGALTRLQASARTSSIPVLVMSGEHGSHAAGHGARRRGEGIFSEARRSRCTLRKDR